MSDEPLTIEELMQLIASPFPAGDERRVTILRAFSRWHEHHDRTKIPAVLREIADNIDRYQAGASTSSTLRYEADKLETSDWSS